jgi:hypothetical protein
VIRTLLLLVLVAACHAAPAGDSAFGAARAGVARAEHGRHRVVRYELPGTVIPPHNHPVDENITVLSGSWYFGEGETWDRGRLVELRPGDYAFAGAGGAMFGWCPDGAVVQVHGMGPFTIHWLHGLKTLDDVDAATVFHFRRGERVQTPTGAGAIEQGYASGDIIQYELRAADGHRFMANQSDLRRP